MITGRGYVPYGRKPKAIPNYLWDSLAGQGDPECKDCGGNIIMTDVEGQYSGQCLNCRDKQQRYIRQPTHDEREPRDELETLVEDEHSAQIGGGTLDEMLERGEGYKERLARANLIKRRKKQRKR